MHCCGYELARRKRSDSSSTEMEQKREEEDATGLNLNKPIVPYVSVLLQRKETIYWNVSNFSQLCDKNCWPAVCITFDSRGSLGRNYTWRLSLYSDQDYLYGRAELIAPVIYRIPYSMKFTVLNKIAETSSFSQEDETRVEEISNQSEPQKWKIIDKNLLAKICKQEDILKLRIDINCFGSETSKGYNIQNYPF